MFGYIYKTTNLLNNKIYVGQHKVDDDSFDTSYLGSGKLLLEALKKYGRNNFKCEIIEWCASQDELNEKEIYYIDLLKSKVTFGNYNMSDGGFVPRLSGELNPRYGVHTKLSDEHRRKISESEKGHRPYFTRKHTPEERAKMGAKARDWNLNHKDYKQLSEHNKGNRMMNKDGICHRVYPEDFEKYLAEGWVFGGLSRKGKYANRDKSKLVTPEKGSRWVNKDGKQRQINPDEFDKYLSEGWVFGMLPRKND